MGPLEYQKQVRKQWERSSDITSACLKLWRRLGNGDWKGVDWWCRAFVCRGADAAWTLRESPWPCGPPIAMKTRSSARRSARAHACRVDTPVDALGHTHTRIWAASSTERLTGVDGDADH